METATRLIKPIFLVESTARADGDAKPYVFMLRNHSSGSWYMENRYRTKASLDRAVEVYAGEFKDDNDGYAPKAGRDFLACKIEDYQLVDEPNEPDWDQIAAERREGARA